MTTTSPEIEFRGIRKTFGAVVANDGVSFAIASRAVHGVVGENGAGKSTIMKVLYGMYAPDEGEIRLRGAKVDIASPQDAIRLGIGMVHQHFMLVPTMTVWQNVVLGAEGGFRLDEAAIREKLDAIQKEFGFSLDLDAVVDALPVGHQQQVELLKLLYRNSAILILDEPTAVLTPQEVDSLFTRLAALRERGKTIVLITHKLKEILRFTQTVTVMRQGRVVDTVPTASLTEETLAEKIIGRRSAKLPERKASTRDEIVLEARDLVVKHGDGARLRGLSLEVRAGEILGIAGVEGNGQQELIECVAGVARDYEGQVRFLGTSLKELSTYDVKQRGLAIVPPDRHREGVVLPFTVWENYILGHHREPRFARGPWLWPGLITGAVAECLDAYDVRPRRTDLPIAALSGGNQQKLVLGREMAGHVKLLIACHPTRGVDIGAIEFIHRRFLALRDEGTAILLVSSELDEILALSDRIAVLYEGRICGAAKRGEASERQLGLWMTGGSA